MKKNYIKILVIIAAFLVLSLTTIASYAYFTANVNTNSQESVITTGNMALEFTDGPEVSLNNAIPNESVTKTFKVKNIGTVETTYDIYLSELINLFADKNDLVYTLTSTNGCADNSEKVVPGIVGEQSKITTCSINPREEHEYTLTILFKEDKTNQDDNKDKKFSAKISVNEYKEPTLTITEKMTILAANGATDLKYDGKKTRGELGTDDNNLRYIGATPNNYVYFNCGTSNPNYMDDETCEKWRIIGLFNNIEDENGNKASRIKIMRDETLGSYSWDATEMTINYGSGINQWGATDNYEGADLMRELNTDYLGETSTTNGKWYSYSGNAQGSMPDEYLYTNTKKMIETVKWNIGSPTNDNGNYDSNWENNLTTYLSYTRERANTNGKTCTSGDYCNDTVTRTSTWIGKVGLMYPSDYGFATNGGSTNSRETCLNTAFLYWAGYSWYTIQVPDCSENSWMKEYKSWTISPESDSDSSNGILYVYGNYVTDSNAATPRHVHPVVFLKSNIMIIEGDGSESNPYKLTM